MNNVVAERNLFINTSTVVQGDGRDVSINLPQGYADCAPDQHMKIALTSFMMEKKFYNVNNSNRRFFITAYDDAAANFNLQSRALELDQGNYRAFGGRQVISEVGNAVEYFYDPRGLGYNIKTKILSALGFTFDTANEHYETITSADNLLEGTPITTASADDLVVVEFNSNTQTYDITLNFDSASFQASSLQPNQSLFPSATFANFKINFFSFELPSYRSIPGNIVDAIITTNLPWSFVDTHELLGGCAVQSNNITTPAQKSDIAQLNKLFEPAEVDPPNPLKNIFRTSFQACLRTTEAIYVRTDLPADNFQTASFDSGNNLYPYVIKSDILAKIPLPNPLSTYSIQFEPQNNYPPRVISNYDYQLPYEYISFQDDGSIFNAGLNTTHLSQIRMFLTDDKGRLIPYESDKQRGCNELYFTATLKVTIMQRA